MSGVSEDIVTPETLAQARARLGRSSRSTKYFQTAEHKYVSCEVYVLPHGKADHAWFGTEREKQLQKLIYDSLLAQMEDGSIGTKAAREFQVDGDGIRVFFQIRTAPCSLQLLAPKLKETLTPSLKWKPFKEMPWSIVAVCCKLEQKAAPTKRKPATISEAFAPSQGLHTPSPPASKRAKWDGSTAIESPTAGTAATATATATAPAGSSSSARRPTVAAASAVSHEDISPASSPGPPSSRNPCFSTVSVDTLVTKARTYLPDMKNIFRGRIPSSRHQRYRSGGAARRGLKFTIGFGDLSDGQQDALLNMLTNEFCKKSSKYLGYVMDVLFPELLVRLFQEIKGVDAEAAEAALQADRKHPFPEPPGPLQPSSAAPSHEGDQGHEDDDDVVFLGNDDDTANRKDESSKSTSSAKEDQ